MKTRSAILPSGQTEQRNTKPPRHRGTVPPTPPPPINKRFLASYTLVQWKSPLTTIQGGRRGVRRRDHVCLNLQRACSALWGLKDSFCLYKHHFSFHGGSFVHRIRVAPFSAGQLQPEVIGVFLGTSVGAVLRTSVGFGADLGCSCLLFASSC